MRVLRAVGSIVLGALVTLALIFAVTLVGYAILFGSDAPNRWLVVATILSASSIPYFVGSILTGYFGRENGWKLSVVIYIPSAAYLLFAFLPLSVADTFFDTVLTFAMACGMALMFSIFGGMFGQRVYSHRQSTHPAVIPDVESTPLKTNPLDTGTPEQ